jgi:hypothetical protein
MEEDIGFRVRFSELPEGSFFRWAGAKGMVYYKLTAEPKVRAVLMNGCGQVDANAIALDAITARLSVIHFQVDQLVSPAPAFGI